MKISELLREGFDPRDSTREADRIADKIHKRFNCKVDQKQNADGSVTITVNGGYMAPETGSDVVNAKNLSDVIDADFRAFRRNGWTFTQPTKGTFTIGVK